MTIVFAQYMLLAIQQRQNENQMERLHHNDLQKQYVFKIFYLNGLILIKVTAFRKMLHCTFSGDIMEIIRDRYLNKLLDRKENGLVKVVTGIRRCGKSYLLFHLYKNKPLSMGVDM